jgi:hypothetical protein
MLVRLPYRTEADSPARDFATSWASSGISLKPLFFIHFMHFFIRHVSGNRLLSVHAEYIYHHRVEMVSCTGLMKT